RQRPRELGARPRRTLPRSGWADRGGELRRGALVEERILRALRAAVRAGVEARDDDEVELEVGEVGRARDPDGARPRRAAGPGALPPERAFDLGEELARSARDLAPADRGGPEIDRGGDLADGAQRARPVAERAERQRRSAARLRAQRGGELR